MTLTNITEAKTFGELHKAIDLLVEPAIPTPSCDEDENTLSNEWEGKRYAARQMYRILRRDFLAKHPKANLQNVPLEKDCDLTIIADLCVDAIVLEQTIANQDNEPLVRIEDAIGEKIISHTRVQRAAKRKKIYSVREGKSPKSPYLVRESEVEKMVGRGKK